MKKTNGRTILVVLVLLMSMLASSCSNAAETNGSSETAAEISTAALTEAPTLKSQEVTQTMEETLTSTTKTEITARGFISSGVPCLGDRNTSYLISEATVHVVDDSALDGINPHKDGEQITLPIGTVVFFLDEYQNPVREPYQDVCHMVLHDGRVIAFATTTGQDGRILLNGVPATDILDRDPFYEPVYEPSDDYVIPETEIIEEVDLGVDTPLDDKDKEYRNINIRVDWNEDGTKDSFCRIMEGKGDEQTVKVIYTDGATGEEQDVTAAFGGGTGFSDSIFLHIDSDGTPCLIDWYAEMDYDVCETYIFEQEMIAQVADQIKSYRYSDGIFVVSEETNVFGAIYQYTDMLLEDGVFVPSGDVITTWFIHDREEIKSKANAPYGMYTMNFEDLPAVDAQGSEFVIPAGTAIFPLYIEYENKDVTEGNFFFGLVDGSICSVGFEKDGSEILISGTEMNTMLFRNIRPGG